MIKFIRSILGLAMTKKEKENFIKTITLEE